MRIFWCFSNFLQLHATLSNYRIGAVTLKILEFEIKRHQLRVEEEKMLDKKKHESEEAMEKYEKDIKRNKKKMKKQDQLLFVIC